MRGDAGRKPRRQTPEEMVNSLVGILHLEQVEMDVFRGGRTNEPSTQVFGGQLIRQALMTACRAPWTPRDHRARCTPTSCDQEIPTFRSSIG